MSCKNGDFSSGGVTDLVDAATNVSNDIFQEDGTLSHWHVQIQCYFTAELAM